MMSNSTKISSTCQTWFPYMKVSKFYINQKYNGKPLKSTKISVTTGKQSFLNGREVIVIRCRKHLAKSLLSTYQAPGYSGSNGVGSLEYTLE